MLRHIQNHERHPAAVSICEGAGRGKFRFLDLADLDWEKEMELACPTNGIGPVTIWQAGRHGALDGAGTPGILSAIKPHVVVVNNGPRKGLGGPSPGAERARTKHHERLTAIPGIEGIWQVHRSLFEGSSNAGFTTIYTTRRSEPVGRT